MVLSVGYRCSDGSDWYWLQLPALQYLTCRASGDMVLGNTAYAATPGPADAIWSSVAAVRGPLEVFGYQSLAFSPGMSVFDLGKQVRESHCSP